MAEFIWPADGLSENVLDAIALEHNLYVGPGSKELVGEDLEEDRAALAHVDIEFARMHPRLPIENVCSRLDNYQPQNGSQEQLLVAAKRLVAYTNPSRLAGFIACGAAGLGKTHVSVGVAKASLMTGQKVCYLNIPTAEVVPSNVIMDEAKAADIVVLDDMNQRYGIQFDSHRACDLLGEMYNRGGGKLLITSNATDIGSFLNNILLPSDPVQRVRIEDRVASSLLGLVIEGQSYRSAIDAGQTPWWDEGTDHFLG